MIQHSFILYIDLRSDYRPQDIRRGFSFLTGGEEGSSNFDFSSFGVYHTVEMVD